MNHYFCDKKPHLLNTINAASAKQLMTATLISSIQNVCFRTTFYVYHFNLKKRIYTSISIKYVD